VIIVGMILTIGLTIFSVRRWLELHKQAVQYSNLYTKMTKLRHESALLGDLSDLLQSCLSSDEAHKLITDRAKILFPGSSGAVCVIANSRDMVEAVATWGEPTFAERFFAPKDCWALRRGKVQLLGDGVTTPGCAHIGENGPQRAMCVPMMAHGEALGLLYLDSGPGKSSEGAVTALDLSELNQRLARTFAEHAALALANLKLREILRTQSVRDPLTGLYNRRYMEESLERELRRAIRKKCPLGVMMLDVDHFKRFNDSFGHEAGDSVLRALSNLFRTQLRGGDVACRYGGEEFAMILPEATLEDTQQRAEQLREAAKSAIAQFRGHSLDTVTLSIGVASYPEKGTTGEALLRAADAALYRAKEDGRDRVVVG
jgi:diguanylate cyclase (GGDEF)-like protein